MDYLLGILAGWFICTFVPVLRYQRIKKRLDQSQIEIQRLQQKLKKYDETVHALDVTRTQMANLRQQLNTTESGKKEDSPPIIHPVSVPAPIIPAPSSISVPTPAIDSDTDSICESLPDATARIEYLHYCAQLQQDTWGDLFKQYGRVRGTLSAVQQQLVHYPDFDKDEVYYTTHGRAYHSVDWCYSLDQANNIYSCPLEEAKDQHLHPCSKCVSPDCR